MNVLPEVNLAPLPPITDEDLAIVPGTTCAMLRMIKGLTNAPSMAEDYDFIGCDGRLVRIPASTRRLGAKLEGAAQAAYLLRLALTGDQRLALDAEDGLWVRLTDQWRPTSDILALTGEKGRGYDELIKATLSKNAGLPRLQLGVRFSNVALLRSGGAVGPDDPLFKAPWAMTLDDREFSPDRVRRGLEAATTVTASMDDARMLCRVAAAPLMRDHLQYIYDLLGTGGNGKGQFLNALLRLYGDLGSPFNFGDFAGIGKVSSTSCEQASLPLTNRLLAVDTEVDDPGLGNQGLVKKAATGECVPLRLLGLNRREVAAIAVMVMVSNRAPSIGSDPSQDRRWRYVNFDKRGAVVDDWWHALKYEDLIVDLFMAGCIEWLEDPVGVNPRPGLVNDLDDWGTETLVRMLGIGTPDPELGFDPDAYLPSCCITVPEGNRDKAAQLGMMGLTSRPKYDVLCLAGDEPSTCRSYVIADPKRFAKFAKAMIRERDVALAAKPDPESKPESDVPGDLTALKPLDRNFGAVETQLGAVCWTGNVFPLRGQGPEPKAPAVTLEPMLRTPATHVDDHCEHDEPMRGFAPAPGFMVLDLDVPKGRDEGKPDGYGVLRALGISVGDPALVVRTGSGGYHLYYRIPAGVDIPQIAHKSVPLSGLPDYEAGVPIDTRVGGVGFVVMPGSVASDGRKWQVVHEGSIEGDHTLPKPLVDLIQRLVHPKAGPKPRPKHPSAPVDGAYVPHMDMAPVAEGARNDTMSRHVWGWLERSRERGMSDAQRDYGLDCIRERFRESGLPDKETEDCIRRTRGKLGL